MDMEFMSGAMGTDMKESGVHVSETGMVLTFFLMEINTSVNIAMVTPTASDNINGLTVTLMLENFLME
jgi:hypothetical protein